MMKTLAVVLTLVMSQLCYAEIQIYQSTDNTGLNKREQIDTVEKYLITLSGQLKNLESKIDSNSLKIKSMETSISAIKDNDTKIQNQLNEKKTPERIEAKKTEASELEKMKADIMAIKNNDIEQIRLDISDLRFSVKSIQTILKVPTKY